MKLTFAPIAVTFATLAAPVFADPLGIPLALGYYVQVGDDCATATDANLAMVHEKGINTPELLCEFEAADEIDLEVWGFAAECEHIEQREPYLNEGTVEIIDDATFRFNDGVIEGRYAYCAPETLPSPYASSPG